MTPSRLRSRLHPLVHRQGDQGFALIEAVITGILLALVVSGSAALLTSVNRSTNRSDTLVATNTAIDADLAAINGISVRLTCCSGTCTVTPPTNFGTSTSSCATNDPRDDRYYFPQRDDTTTTANFANTTTPKEPDAVDQLCAVANNTVFMTPLQNAVDALPVPTGTTRATQINANHILQVTYTDTTDNRVVRVANILPPMANWCP